MHCDCLLWPIQSPLEDPKKIRINQTVHLLRHLQCSFLISCVVLRKWQSFWRSLKKTHQWICRDQAPKLQKCALSLKRLINLPVPIAGKANRGMIESVAPIIFRKRGQWIKATASPEPNLCGPRVTQRMRRIIFNHCLSTPLVDGGLLLSSPILMAFCQLYSPESGQSFDVVSPCGYWTNG